MFLKKKKKKTSKIKNVIENNQYNDLFRKHKYISLLFYCKVLTSSLGKCVHHQSSAKLYLNYFRSRKYTGLDFSKSPKFHLVHITNLPQINLQLTKQLLTAFLNLNIKSCVMLFLPCLTRK